MLNLKNYLVSEEKIYIDDIPLIIFRPDKPGKVDNLIFYHGWSSNKEAQRFRAYSIASLGYNVLIGDAINHGERFPLKSYNPREGIGFEFIETLIRSIREYPLIEKYIREELSKDGDIYVSGHSMGGFTAGGVFTHYPSVKSAIVLNGSLDWQASMDILDEEHDLESYFEVLDSDKKQRLEKNLEAFKELDPSQNLSKIIDRPLKIIHGQIDPVVSIKPQLRFYRELKPKYENRKLIDMTVIESLTHHVTSLMIELLIDWMRR